MTTDIEPGNLLTQASHSTPLVGLIVKMSNYAIIELAGHLNFDFVLIDTEHGVGGGLELDQHLRAADAAGIPAVVRVSTLSRTEVARALDGGAIGVVIPQVESTEEAATAVQFAHYPPIGRRGLATSTRAGHQGVLTAEEHLAAAKKDTLVIVQIESRAGVENCASIFAVPGVSALWIGLNDLTLEYGHHNQLEHPEIQAALNTVLTHAHATSTPVFIIADDDETARLWAARGARALLINFLSIAARSLSTLRESHRRLVSGEIA